MLARLHTRLSGVFFSTSAYICKRSGLVILPKTHQETLKKKKHFAIGSSESCSSNCGIILIRPNYNGCNYGIIVIISWNDSVLTSHRRRANYGGSPHTFVLAATPSSHLSVLMIAALKPPSPPTSCPHQSSSSLVTRFSFFG